MAKKQYTDEQKTTLPRNINYDEPPFSELSDNQMRFITAMVAHPSWTKADAARYLGLNMRTPYKWGAHVDEALQILRLSVEDAARETIQHLLMEAVEVKRKLLQSRNESIRSKVATEIIEWNLGKATTRAEHTGADGGPIEILSFEDFIERAGGRLNDD